MKLNTKEFLINPTGIFEDTGMWRRPFKVTREVEGIIHSYFSYGIEFSRRYVIIDLSLKGVQSEMKVKARLHQKLEQDFHR